MASKDFCAEFGGKGRVENGNLVLDSLNVMVESKERLLKDPKYIAVLSWMLKHGKEKYVRKVTGNDLSFVGAGTESLGLTHKGCPSMSPGNT